MVRPANEATKKLLDKLNELEEQLSFVSGTILLPDGVTIEQFYDSGTTTYFRAEGDMARIWFPEEMTVPGDPDEDEFVRSLNTDNSTCVHPIRHLGGYLLGELD